MSTALAPSRRLANGLLSVTTAVVGVGLTLGAWWLLSLRLEPVQLPSPGAVGEAFLDGWSGIDALEFVGFQTGGIRDGLIYTTRNVLLGVGVGAVLGLLVGWVIGSSRTTAAVLGPPLVVLGATPVLVVLPFLLIWFGTNSLAQALLVVAFTLVTVAGVTQQAVVNVGEHYTNFASSLGARRRYLLWHVTRPAVAPAAIGAIRVSVAMGWSFATVAELLGGQEGSGKIILAMAQLQRTADVIAVVLSVAAVAVVVDALIAATGRSIVRWQE